MRLIGRLLLVALLASGCVLAQRHGGGMAGGTRGGIGGRVGAGPAFGSLGGSRVFGGFGYPGNMFFGTRFRGSGFYGGYRPFGYGLGYGYGWPLYGGLSFCAGKRSWSRSPQRRITARGPTGV